MSVCDSGSVCLAYLKGVPEIEPDRDIRPIGGLIVEAKVLGSTFEGREFWRPLDGSTALRSPLFEVVVGRTRGPLAEPRDTEC